MSESIQIKAGMNMFQGLRSLGRASNPETVRTDLKPPSGAETSEAVALTKVESSVEIAGNLARKLKSGDLFAMQTRFFRDEQTGDMKAEIIDNRTGDIVMKIPFRDAIDIISSLDFEQRMGLNVTA